MSPMRRVFPETFKREAVDRVVSSGLTIAKVAAELGLNETVLRRWVVRLSSEATGTARRPITQAPVPSPSDLVSEVTRLRRENERLRMERDILKKSRSSSDRPPDEVRVHRSASQYLAGQGDVLCLGTVRQLLLCLAISAGKPACLQ
jgi:transposase